MYIIKMLLVATGIVALLLLFRACSLIDPQMKVEKCWWCGSQVQLSGQRVFSSWFHDKTFISPCCSICRDTLLMGLNAKYIVYNDTVFSMFQIDTSSSKHILDDLFIRPIFVEVPLHNQNWTDLQKAYYNKLWGF